MTGESKPNSRIVSKTAFLVYLASSWAFTALGGLVIAAAAVMGLMLAALALAAACIVWCTPALLIFVIVGILAVLGPAMVLAFWIGGRCFDHASSMPSLVPLTRRTIAELSEPDSLVRASAEPDIEADRAFAGGAGWARAARGRVVARESQSERR
jgi:hypothetical protein